MSLLSPQFKRVSFSRYIHISQVERLGAEDRDVLRSALDLVPDAADSFNVIKFQDDGSQVTLLEYEPFDDSAFPALLRYWTVSLEGSSFRFRSYQTSLNPPILHRKELLLGPDHPQYKRYVALTQSAEDIDLFRDAHRIGFKRAWDHLLRGAGYEVSGQELVPIGNDMSTGVDDVEAAFDEGIARYKTAMVRYGFSVPVQCLARFGFLDGTNSFFDYGCGRGDDMRGLSANGIEVAGWDPHYLPEASIQAADIVNLGFVINVIENRDERDEAIKKAHSLARKLLVVSAMLAGEDAVAGKPFGDGILTTRGTFQKYFTQGSLKDYIDEVLDEDAIPVAPGVFFVFTDKDSEQAFSYGRQQSRRNLLRNVERVRQHKLTASERRDKFYEEHKELVDGLWDRILLLGREPEADELVESLAVLETFGTLKKAVRFVWGIYHDEQGAFEESRRLRADDIRVYVAKLLFEKRRQYKDLERGLQRDVKAFFGDYKEATLQARDLLLNLKSVELIYSACLYASNEGLGWLDHEDALHVQSSHVEQLPALLRAYINCGLVLYGDISTVDLIKIHVRTNKLSLMAYDGFDTDLLPRLKRRIKIDLRSLDFDEFFYGESYPQTYLYRKSRFMNEEDSGFADQIAFEEKLSQLSLLPAETSYGPSMEEFDRQLSEFRYQVEGGVIKRNLSTPALDDSCGRYLTFRDLIHCGETQESLGLDNMPKQPESFNALLDLAVHVLDPVIEYFGMIRLTYGFCSHELSRKVPGRNAPDLDQHSALELNSRGKPLCKRGGAAADFIIEYEDMREVAQWIVRHCSFDRLYFYGTDKPLHVSFSQSNIAQVTDLTQLNSKGHRIPRSVSSSEFLN
jgi:DNA phosphorothioation-associated putative methyltransferase